MTLGTLAVDLTSTEVTAYALAAAGLALALLLLLRISRVVQRVEASLSQLVTGRNRGIEAKGSGSLPALNSIEDLLTDQTRWLERVESSLDALYRQLSKPMVRSMEQLGSIADELDSRRSEVEKFRRGQEGMVAKKMLSEVVRIRCDFAAEAEDPRMDGQRALYEDLLELVDNHLVASGVETRSPRVGAEFRGNDLCEDQPATVATKDATLDWTIASVQSPAWVYEEGSKLTVLAKARVTIHRLNVTGEDRNDG